MKNRFNWAGKIERFAKVSSSIGLTSSLKHHAIIFIP